MPDDIASDPRAIADLLRKEITDGTWEAGTVRSLSTIAEHFATTRYYANMAVRRLRDSGIVDTCSGGRGGIAPHGTMPPQWDVPGRAEIQTAVRKRIGDGTYPVGAFMPSVTTLCAEFGVSRFTIHVSLHALRDEGILSTSGGRTLVVKGLPSEAGESDQAAPGHHGTDPEAERELDCA
ncbi:GntR family transcriptional regulator [Streptomyces tauricus]|uniref:GntR family transcriptional regulator n=1 Tax=Streptomyces tauricus TaxID=68274 RepID=UPI002242D5A6|nr:GntR family transcriptional regulator [Streptomyces tauricus]MCW8095846.1 GntR family transcriptional regulator [Streptomyces tauricus]